MAIEKRTGTDGKPAYRVRIATYDPATGHRRNLTIGTFDRKKDAENAERDALVQRDRGTLLSPDDTTVAELLDKWLTVEVPKTVREENRIAYEIVIRKHLVPALGAVKVRKLTVERVELFYADLHTRGYSSSLIRKCHMRLKSALTLAKRWGLVADNVCDVVKTPKVTYRRQKVWTAEETSAFLDVAADDGLHPYWLLAVETGARTSELLGVSWHDVDVERGTIRFGHQVVRLNHGTPFVKESAKTTAGDRTIRLTAYTRDELKAHRKRWLARKLAASEWENPYELVFCGPTGKPVNARNVRRSFDRLVKLAGVEPIPPHSLRRTHITTAIAAGANVKAVAARVGHRDLTTTLQTYAQLVPQMEDELLDIVERIVPRPVERATS